MTRFSAELTTLAREESGGVIALLALRFGIDAADDAVQEAFTEALDWTVVPDNPAAWLYTVARNRAIDRIRREAAASRRELATARDLAAVAPAMFDPEARERVAIISDDAPAGDEQLRLMLLCAHPALSLESQLALTLRLVAGLTTAEIAAAFLVPEATLAQRIVRAKRKIRDAGIPLSIPASLDDRLRTLRGVLYLVFNEGYLARGGSSGARVDLMEQAIRLTVLLLGEVPGDAETEGLLALELFTAARNATRFDGEDLVLLEDQDRSRWDRALIKQGNAVLAAAMRRGRPGVFQLQATIAGCHANAKTSTDTDWPMIVRMYRMLMTAEPSPVVAVNLAVAIAMANGPRAGIVALDEVTGLDKYHLFWAARGELLLRVGDQSAARGALEQALRLAANPAERRHIARRIATTNSKDVQASM